MGRRGGAKRPPPRKKANPRARRTMTALPKSSVGHRAGSVGWRRLSDWPLRVKVAALLVLASLVPLLIAAIIDVRQARDQARATTGALLAARGDQLVRELDMFHRGYQRSAARLARLPDVVAFCLETGASAAPLEPRTHATLDPWPASSPEIRGAAILDLSGTVRIATESALQSKSLAFHGYVREALRGKSVISDIHVAEPEVERVPSIAY